MLAAYSFALALVLLLGLPYWALRMATAGKYRRGLAQRLGLGLRGLRGERRAIWVHAVSVGEVAAAERLVRELATQAPEYRVLLSTTTLTGQTLARERLDVSRTFYFPLDLPWIVRRYLRVLRPALLVLVESEFWPNLLHRCGREGIPVAVVNGRISDRSLPRYLRLRFFWRRVLSSLSIVLTQSEEDARRFRAIGAPADRVATGGNLKFDVRGAGSGAVAQVLRAHLPPGAKVLVCGSTAPGEEEMLLDAFRALHSQIPNLAMVLAPRRPERFAAVAEMLRARGEMALRCSLWMERPARIEAGTILLLDSIGDLASVYSLSTVAFVGWSLTPDGGGHNPLEPAQYAVPIVMGGHYRNFRAIVELLREREALQLAEEESLIPVFLRLLTDPEAAGSMGARALEVFDSQAGATGRAVTALLRLLPERNADPDGGSRGGARAGAEA